MDPEVILSVCPNHEIILLDSGNIHTSDIRSCGQQMPIQAPWSGQGISLVVATLLKTNDLPSVTLWPIDSHRLN